MVRLVCLQSPASFLNLDEFQSHTTGDPLLCAETLNDCLPTSAGQAIHIPPLAISLAFSLLCACLSTPSASPFQFAAVRAMWNLCDG